MNNKRKTKVKFTSVIDNLFYKHRYPDAAPQTSYEFCPRCEANLTLQKDYNNQLPYWICRGCGEMLINPAVDNADDDIAWIVISAERC